MKQFEHDLKTIESKCVPGAIVLAESLSIPEDRLRFLSALGLVELRPAWDNLHQIALTDAGVTYFYRKSESRKNIIASWTINFAVAVLSAMCGSAFTLILQRIITM